MADDQCQFITEGTSLTRPPGFVGEDYPYWKDKMKMYIKSTQYRIWLIITNGDIRIHRLEAGWIDDNLAIMELNTKARYTLTCAISKNEYNKICRLRTTKEIWDSLSINHEGTEDVRLRNVVTLTRHFESFTMKDEESVDDMFGRLQVLLKNLNAIG